jgi:hypothetical protein
MSLIVEIQAVGHQLLKLNLAKGVKGPRATGTAAFTAFPATASAMLPTMLATGGSTV